ncbi:hypothetical protein L1049_005171 [Liquidambar formosana]|uniref:Pectinesterase inhibitor domain-containing protein n=1 Tax=Liquidambar formosana TaxID=63359 RepID=A0AAP0RTV4_LIQFO
MHVHKHIQLAHSTCQGTLYPDLCVSTLSSFPDLTSKSLPQIISATLNRTITEVRASSSNCSAIRKKVKKLDPLDKRALEDCAELFDDTVSVLKTAVSDLSPNKSTSQHYNDLQTLLSGAMKISTLALMGSLTVKET